MHFLPNLSKLGGLLEVLECASSSSLSLSASAAGLQICSLCLEFAILMTSWPYTWLWWHHFLLRFFKECIFYGSTENGLQGLGAGSSPRQMVSMVSNNFPKLYFNQRSIVFFGFLKVNKLHLLARNQN